MTTSGTLDQGALPAFVHINKTAGSTMKFVLRNSLCLRYCNLISREPMTADDGDLEFARRVYRFGLRCVSGHDLRGPSDRIATPLQRFTILRDPTRRCLSHYLHRKRVASRGGRDLTLPRFLRRDGVRDLQTRMIAGAPDVERAKQELEDYLFVGLTEHFDESLLAFASLSPFPVRLAYERRHVTGSTSERDEILADPASLRQLEQANELDQQLYDFVRDDLYPRLLAEAAKRPELASTEIAELDGPTLRYTVGRRFQLGIYAHLAKRRRR